ncbi:nuclear transport factor 2 family protein [Haloferacaceae archaeon DSL9]
MNAEETVAAYYDALRAGDPLVPFFADRPTTVKFGLSEALRGYSEVADGLEEQTETTTDWTIDSAELRVTERESFAWFSDRVAMSWTNAATGDARRFETRWSGALERRGDGWKFVSMHVSAPTDLDADAGHDD